MTLIQQASGWNNSAGLTTLSIQPRTSVPEPGRRQRGGDGRIVEDGFYHQTWTWGFFSVAAYQAMLTELGLASATSVQRTARTLWTDGSYSVRNAILTRPASLEFYGKFTEVTVDVILLGVAS